MTKKAHTSDGKARPNTPPEDDTFDTSPEAMAKAAAKNPELVAIVDRFSRLIEEAAGVQDDIKETFDEAKTQGFNPKTMRSIIRLRAMERDARLEEESLLDTYKSALGLDD